MGSHRSLSTITDDRVGEDSQSAQISSIRAPQRYSAKARRCKKPPYRQLALAIFAFLPVNVSAQLPSYAVNISAGATCPTGTEAPTVDWCRWYADQLGYYFLDKSQFFIGGGAMMSCGKGARTRTNAQVHSMTDCAAKLSAMYVILSPPLGCQLFSP